MAEEGKRMGMAFSIFVVMHKGLRLVRNSHPRPTNLELELELVYMVRAPGAGINLRPIPR